jgi:hypothetical protein
MDYSLKVIGEGLIAVMCPINTVAIFVTHAGSPLFFGAMS